MSYNTCRAKAVEIDYPYLYENMVDNLIREVIMNKRKWMLSNGVWSVSVRSREFYLKDSVLFITNNDETIYFGKYTWVDLAKTPQAFTKLLEHILFEQ